MIRTLLKITLIILIGTSCSRKEKKDLTIISGHIPELASRTIRIELYDSTFDCNIDNSGRFQFEIPLDKPRYLFVKGLDKKLFFLPGDSLLVEKVDDKYKFSGGQSALINNYYTDWKTYLYAVADTSDSEKYYNQKPDDFLKSVDKWIEIWKKPFYELQKNNPDLNKDFIALENARIKYWMYGDLNDYNYNNAEIPNGFYQYLNEVNLNDINLLQFDEYNYFLSSYVFLQARRLNINDNILKTSKMLDLIQEAFQQELIRNEISKEIIRLQTSKLCINDTLIDRFKTICTNTHYKNEVEKNYQNLKPLLKGNKAPDFEFVGLNGNKVSLNDFKGKYLLIDVWSITCAPCIREIPIMEKLKQDLKGQNIEIIAACLSDASAWEKTLTKHKLKEGQYRIEKGWNSEFKTDYLKSSGVPVYILIDPQGMIINARAPKPSENLREIIKNLNI